jgi:hypothetical protein
MVGRRHRSYRRRRPSPHCGRRADHGRHCGRHARHSPAAVEARRDGLYRGRAARRSRCDPAGYLSAAPRARLGLYRRVCMPVAPAIALSVRDSWRSCCHVVSPPICGCETVRRPISLPLRSSLRTSGGMLEDPRPDEEERGGHVAPLEHPQDLGRPTRVGPVVEGERDGVLSGRRRRRTSASETRGVGPRIDCAWIPRPSGGHPVGTVARSAPPRRATYGSFRNSVRFLFRAVGQSALIRFSCLTVPSFSAHAGSRRSRQM